MANWCWRCLFLLGAILTFTTADGQYDYLLHKSYAQRAPFLWKIGDSVFSQPDSAAAFRITDRLAAFGMNNGDAALQLEGELYRIYYIWGHFFLQNRERVLNTLNGILDRAIRGKVREAEFKTRTVLASYWWDGMHNYEQALEEYSRLDQLLESVSFSDYPEKVQVLYLIGSAYFDFKDYEKAIQYFRRIPEMPGNINFQQFDYIHSFNKLTVAYQQLGRLDSSDYYLHRFYDSYSRRLETEKTPDSIWLYIIRGDLGYNQYLRGRLQQAIPLLKTCVDRGLAVQDYDIVAEYLMPLADIYYKTGQEKLAIAATLQAKSSVERSHLYNQWWRWLYPLLSKMYALQGRPALAGLYIDSAMSLADSLDRQFSAQLMARAEQKAVITSQKQELAAARSSQQLLTLKLYASMALAGVILIASLFLYRVRRRQHRQEQALKEMQLKEAARLLDDARQELYDFAAHIAEKNQLIEKMEAQVGNTKVLEELDKSVILTGSDWRRFRDLFEQVHPGWLQRLNEKVPGISPSEIRLMALARLNFSNKEMANTLGVTPQAIRVTWHRLRKKLDLPEDETLEGLVATVG